MGVSVGVAVEGAKVGSGVRVGVAGVIAGVGVAWVAEQAERRERSAARIAIRFVA